MEGTKHDSNKLRYDLLIDEALEEDVAVLTYGSKKYTDNNWQLVSSSRKRYIAAHFRHLIAYKKGERFDPDSGLPHLAHCRMNLAFLSWFDIYRP